LPELHRSHHLENIGGFIPVNGEYAALSPLTRPNLGVDHRDWTNNSVWLHKPLLPFYIAAASYRLFGQSLWALRLPGAVFALLTTVVLYSAGHKFFDERVGLCGAAIFAFNPYTNELVHGRALSGFPDLAFALFISLGLYLILQWQESRSGGSLRWLGFVLGLAYFCKGGLALAPFVALAIMICLGGTKRDLIVAVQSPLVFGMVVLPIAMYWLKHRPLEYQYEQQQQLLHLFRSIEGHGEACQTYLIKYLPGILGFAVVPLAYFSVVWALAKLKPTKPEFTLSIWALVYLIPLSFAVSKIPNFIYGMVPAISLLLPSIVLDLIRNRRFTLILSLCATSAATFGISSAFRDSQHPGRLIFLVAAVFFLAVLGIFSFVKIQSSIAAAVIALSFEALFLLYARTDILKNQAEPPDAASQFAVRDTGAGIHQVAHDALVLAHDRQLELGYLYLMYWSGADVLDVCREPLPSTTLERLRSWQNTYLLSPQTLPVPSLAVLPTGKLYSLRDVPFELWAAAATASCR
jgi:4-amino-4-deoxy-L-arabinose transferase-like glycosyltransferase